MSKITRKFFKTKATSINDDAKTVSFRISDNQPDRMGEIVDQKSWDFKHYLKNPIVLWGHNPDEPENVLGTALSLSIADDGSGTDAELHLDTDINPKAALVYNQIKAGTLSCVSVGFIPHSVEYAFDDEEETDNTPVLKDNELLEISIVPIPANPRAIALGVKDGSISRKDAKWLMDSMRKEADLLEEQLDKPEINEPKEKSMTDEQAQALIDGMTKLTEKVDALTEENKTLREQVETLKPVDNSDNSHTDNETKDDESKEEDTTPPAKPGDDDQGGAAEDEFDETAELTPEQEAEAREALGLAPAA